MLRCMDDDTPQTLRTTRRRRCSSSWTPVTRGVARATTADDPWVAGLHAWLSVLPDGARFTHLTAARLREWWLPPLPDDLPVLVVLPEDAPRIRRPGLVCVRRRATVAPETVAGLPVDPAPETLLMCARDLGEIDLVCLGEAAVVAGGCGRDEIEAVAASRRRGAPTLRRAAARIDGRAESIWEVLLRELHIACDIDVQPQREAHDADGTFLARGDLWLVGTWTFHEYDGADHLDRKRQRQDRKRDRRLGRSRWVRRGYTAEDVLHQAVTILADADAAIGREHDPSRIRVWHALLRESLFTPAGMQRLRRRLGLSGTGHSGAA